MVVVGVGAAEVHFAAFRIAFLIAKGGASIRSLKKSTSHSIRGGMATLRSRSREP